MDSSSREPPLPPVLEELPTLANMDSVNGSRPQEDSLAGWNGIPSASQVDIDGDGVATSLSHLAGQHMPGARSNAANRGQTQSLAAAETSSEHGSLGGFGGFPELNLPIGISPPRVPSPVQKGILFSRSSLSSSQDLDVKLPMPQQGQEQQPSQLQQGLPPWQGTPQYPEQQLLAQQPQQLHQPFPQQQEQQPLVPGQQDSQQPPTSSVSLNQGMGQPDFASSESQRSQPAVIMWPDSAMLQQASPRWRPRRHSPLWYELRTLLKLSTPCIIIAGAPQLLLVTSQVFAGHMGTEQLAAVALSNSMWSFFYYIIVGVSTALETLGAQAAGARDRSRLVVWGLSAFICMSLFGLPIAGILWNGGKVAAALLGQDDEASARIGAYCKQLVPGLPFQIWAVLASKMMQVQSYMLLPALVMLSGVVVNVVLTFVLVEGMPDFGLPSWGFPGVPVAATASRVYMFVAMLVALMAWEAHQLGTEWGSMRTWMRGIHRWNRAKQGKVLGRFLHLGLFGAATMGLEFAAFEVTTAMAGYLGAVQVSAHASAFSLATLAFLCVPVAVSIATGIRIASLLGAGAATQAKLCARAAMATGASVAVLLASLLLLYRGQIGWLFTGDSAVVELVSDIAPLVAAYQIALGLMGASQGVLRGCGRQGQLLVHNVLGFGSGVSAGWWLTFGDRQMGVRGLWLGILGGVALVAGLNLVAMAALDWSREVRVARTMQAIRETNRRRRSLIAHALEDEEDADEALVEALLEEAQQDPRPLHIIYQNYYLQEEVARPASPPPRSSTNSPVPQARPVDSSGQLHYVLLTE